ncbi:MAG: hypothetical protein HC902_02960 [Calothrix sp. SM1_5_4]|nr:hypothetical protein [Calothrix sp. SM1_5_4]
MDTSTDKGPEEIEKLLEIEIGRERESTVRILRLLLVAADLKLYAERGFPNMTRWLMSRYKYSESAARRRVFAAEMLRHTPSSLAKLESGDLSLSAVSRAQSVIWGHEKATGVRVSREEKDKLLGLLEGKSTHEIDRILMGWFPDQVRTPRDKVSVVDEDTFLLHVKVPAQAVEDLDYLRDLHSNANAGDGEIIAKALKLLREQTSAAAQSSTAAVKPRVTKTLTPRIKREVIRAAGGKCSYVDPLTGRRCNSSPQA